MPLDIHRVQVWSGEIPDKPGATAAKLEALIQAGVDLKFIFARTHPTKSDRGLVHLAPIVGSEQTQAARRVGLTPDPDIAMLCVESDTATSSSPGLGYEMMSRLAVANINLRGLSISSVGSRVAAYLAFDNPDTATQALQILATLM